MLYDERFCVGVALGAEIGLVRLGENFMLGFDQTFQVRVDRLSPRLGLAGCRDLPRHAIGFGFPLTVRRSLLLSRTRIADKARESLALLPAMGADLAHRTTARSRSHGALAGMAYTREQVCAGKRTETQIQRDRPQGAAPKVCVAEQMRTVSHRLRFPPDALRPTLGESAAGSCESAGRRSRNDRSAEASSWECPRSRRSRPMSIQSPAPSRSAEEGSPARTAAGFSAASRPRNGTPVHRATCLHTLAAKPDG